MTNATGGEGSGQRSWNGAHLAALLGGNAALALGPYFVRLADSGPVSAGLWRLVLAVPFLALISVATGQKLTGFRPQVWLAMAGAGVFFALDLGSWHIGIGMTRLGNASLFGNSGSLIVMAWGLIALHRAPHRSEWLAFGLAVLGSLVLMGRSLEIGRETLIGDLFCLTAGLLYAGYIMLLQRPRASLGNWSLLTWSSIAGAPVLLGIALALGEPILPSHWGPLIALAVCSQILGQGLLIFALRHFTPLVFGLALLAQPAVSVAAGWLAFGETLGWMDLAGMAMVAAGLALARSTQD